MAPLELTELKIEEDSATSDIKKLLKVVKPEWLHDAIQIKKMTGGTPNLSYHCYSIDNQEEGVTVRVKKLQLMKKIPVIVEGFEHKAVGVASELGLFPKVFAIFQNGYCYEYIPGEVLVNYTEIKDTLNLPLYEEAILKRIAKKLAFIHSVNMEDENYSKSGYFGRVLETLSNLYPEKPDIPNKNSLQVELEEMITYADQLQLKVVFCHGDVHAGNMIWNKAKEELTFIDWECAHIGLQAYEVAKFLKNFTFFDLDLGPEKILPKEETEKLQAQFLRFYLDERSQQYGEQIDYILFRKQVKLCELMYYVISPILIGSIFIDAGIKAPMDSKRMVNGFFETYMEQKNTVLHELGLI